MIVVEAGEHVDLANIRHPLHIQKQTNKRGSHKQYHIHKQVLTSVRSYDEAVEQLKREPLCAPVYFITAGSQSGQGAVIIRDRNFLRSFIPLHVSLPADPNSWYLLETNYVR